VVFSVRQEKVFPGPLKPPKPKDSGDDAIVKKGRQKLEPGGVTDPPQKAKKWPLVRPGKQNRTNKSKREVQRGPFSEKTFAGEWSTSHRAKN